MNDSITSILKGAKAQATTGADELPVYDRSVKLHVTCLNLRHKLMYVDERHMQRGMTDDSSSTRVFWCSKTQNCLGPDNEPVAPDSCSQGRPCYCQGE